MIIIFLLLGTCFCFICISFVWVSDCLSECVCECVQAKACSYVSYKYIKKSAARGRMEARSCLQRADINLLAPLSCYCCRICVCFCHFNLTQLNTLYSVPSLPRPFPFLALPVPDKGTQSFVWFLLCVQPATRESRGTNNYHWYKSIMHIGICEMENTNAYLYKHIYPDIWLIKMLQLFKPVSILKFYKEKRITIIRNTAW